MLWRFDKEEYEAIKSSKIIEEDRMKKLDKIRDSQLKRLGDHIREKRFAGYQELLTEIYIEDINGIL